MSTTLDVPNFDAAILAAIDWTVIAANGTTAHAIR
jgi:hypothetical protein